MWGFDLGSSVVFQLISILLCTPGFGGRASGLCVHAQSLNRTASLRRGGQDFPLKVTNNLNR